MRRVKSNGISSTLLNLFDRERAVQLLMVEDGAVQDVFEAGLEVAEEIGVLQHGLALALEHVTVDFQDDMVGGERARLVGAEHVHGAEVLDGVEALNDDFLFGHRQRAFGEANRDDHRQHLRGQPYRHRHGEEEGFFPILLEDAIDDEHQRHHYQHEPDHQPGEPLDPAIEGGFNLLPGETAGHFAEVGPRPGRYDHRGGRAAFDAGAQEAGVEPLDRRNSPTQVAGVGLLDWHGFPCQGGLDEEQVFGGKQPDVAGDHVAGREFDDVAGDKLLKGDLSSLAAAHHGGGDADHGFEFGGGGVRAGLLDEPER